jgi:hypothetical protein
MTTELGDHHKQTQMQACKLKTKIRFGVQYIPQQTMGMFSQKLLNASIIFTNVLPEGHRWQHL